LQNCTNRKMGGGGGGGVFWKKNTTKYHPPFYFLKPLRGLIFLSKFKQNHQNTPPPSPSLLDFHFEILQTCHVFAIASTRTNITCSKPATFLHLQQTNYFGIDSHLHSTSQIKGFQNNKRKGKITAKFG
jgi:hypothetical protein